MATLDLEALNSNLQLTPAMAVYSVAIKPTRSSAMKSHRSTWPRLLLTAAALTLAGQSLAAEVLEKTEDIAGTTVHYKVILPKRYDPAKAYPAVLAFPGGPQTMDTVEGTVERNWREQAERLGYIVIVPAAPNGQLFFEEGAAVFPDFVIRLFGDFKILGNKFHIAGVSNGGLSAFHIAASYPQYFWSVTGLPGYLLNATPARVSALAKMCINMYAGETDTDWLKSEKQQTAQFRGQGFIVKFSEERGEDHVMRTLEGEGAVRLFKQFEQARHGCGK
jgi:poly(3-hydroxybutyrate) depolymerase